MSSRTLMIWLGSSPTVGSSRISTAGLWMSAPARATRCRYPFDRVPTTCRRTSWSMQRSQTSCSRRSPTSDRGTSSTSRGSAGTPPPAARGRGARSRAGSRSCRRSPTGSASRSTPATTIRPAVGGRKAVIMRMAVVLPAPLGPRNPSTWPSGTKNDTSSTTGWSTYTLVSRFNLDHRCRLPWSRRSKDDAVAASSAGSERSICWYSKSWARIKDAGRLGSRRGAQVWPGGCAGTAVCGVADRI